MPCACMSTVKILMIVSLLRFVMPCEIDKLMTRFYVLFRGGRVVRWCWVNFQCWGVLQFGYSRARAYCACSRCGWGLFGHFYSHLSFPLSPSLWETARYRLKYCLKGPLNQKQPTNLRPFQQYFSHIRKMDGW